MQQECKRLTSTVFGAVHSDSTMVVSLHKHLSSCLNTFCNSINIITCCMYATMNKPDMTPYVNNSFTFFKSADYV